MTTIKCPKCGIPLKRRSYRHYGFGGLLLTIALVIVQIITDTILVFMDIGAVGLSIYLIIRKPKYFFFCKRCVLKFSQKEK
jgi:hypothetical protein